MSNTLTAAEIEWMRAEIEDVVMADSCNILTITYTSDGQGGLVESWGTATSGVLCRIAPMQNREMLSGDAMQPFRRFKVTLPHGTDVSEVSRLEISGVQYNILGIDTGKGWSLNMRLEVEKV